MGEAAKAFWNEEEEVSQQADQGEFEDVAFISTGITDYLWKLGTD